MLKTRHNVGLGKLRSRDMVRLLNSVVMENGTRLNGYDTKSALGLGAAHEAASW